MKLLSLLESIEIFYHGSNTKIEKFTLDFLSSSTNIDQEGPGIYLTSSEKDAMMYGHYLHKVSVKIVKSRMMPEKRMLNPTFVSHLISKAPNYVDNMTNWAENINKARRLATDAIMSAYGPSDYREAMESIWGDHYRNDSKVWLNTMVSKGWDGFILDRADIFHEKSKHLIVFNPEILTIL